MKPTDGDMCKYRELGAKATEAEKEFRTAEDYEQQARSEFRRAQNKLQRWCFDEMVRREEAIRQAEADKTAKAAAI